MIGTVYSRFVCSEQINWMNKKRTQMIKREKKDGNERSDSNHNVKIYGQNDENKNYQQQRIQSKM